MASDRTWPVQEAQQRFSELLRAVDRDGPQTIAKHGEEVAVVIDTVEYRRLTGARKAFVEHLLSMPALDDEAAAVFDEIEAERKAQFARAIVNPS